MTKTIECKEWRVKRQPHENWGDTNMKQDKVSRGHYMMIKGNPSRRNNYYKYI